MDIARFFKENIDYINGVVSLHKGGIEHGVILSNLYLYLAENEKVNNDNIKGFIISYCSKIRKWRKRGVMFEERSKVDKLDNLILTSSHTLNVDFNTKLQEFCESLSYNDRCIILDYYSNPNIQSIEDYQRFFKAKRRTAFEIKKKIKLINNQLYSYINNQLC